MKIIEILQGCTNCVVKENNLIYELMGMVYINASPFRKSSMDSLISFNKSLYFNESTILYEINNDFSLTERFMFEEADSVKIISPNIIEIFKRLSRKELQYIFYNWNYEELWRNNADQWVDIINNNYVKLRDRLETNEKEFTLIDINNGLPIWHYTLPDGFKIFGSVQAIDDVLFFKAMKDNRFQLVTGLNIHTGEVIYQNQFEITYKGKFISAQAYNSSDKLYYGLGDLYQIFNPKTGEIVLEKAIKECDSKIIRPYVSSVYENKLWFISGQYEEVKFGCLDLDKQEIDFIQEFPQENDEMFEAPIYHENKLYLKGIHYNQLYVFE